MAQSTYPPVSIVIPTYQGEQWLLQNLPVIRDQHYPSQVEIVAVDSASTDGTVDVLKRYDAKVLEISNAEFSHGYARNLGVQNASSPIILFMSQDVLPVGENWLMRMIHLLDDPQVGAAHVRQLPRPGATPLERFFHEEMYPSQSKRFELQPGEKVTLDKIFFSNVCSITRKELCEAFPFEENVIMSEDQAFAKALLLAGNHTFYSGEIEVIHSHHYDLKTLFRRNFDSAYSLLGITEEDALTLANAGVRYMWREARYLFQQGAFGWLLFLPVYESVRIAGRLFGSRAEQLPASLRERMSLHRNFWQRQRITN